MYKVIDTNTNMVVVGEVHEQTLSDCLKALQLILGEDATLKQALEAGYIIEKD